MKKSCYILETIHAKSDERVTVLETTADIPSLFGLLSGLEARGALSEETEDIARVWTVQTGEVTEVVDVKSLYHQDKQSLDWNALNRELATLDGELLKSGQVTELVGEERPGGAMSLAMYGELTVDLAA